jgi:hypothetical protein
MKFLQKIESSSILEILVGLVFLFFIILPVHPQRPVAAFFDSSLGMVVLFGLTLFFFLYTNPILGVLFIFVSYELLRRSMLIVKDVPILLSPSSNNYSLPAQHSQVRPKNTQDHPDKIKPLNRDYVVTSEHQKQRDAEMISLNPPSQQSLEEEVISKYGPITTNQPAEYNQPSYSPVISNQIDASLYAS